MAAYNFFAFYTASKQGKTGLTVTVDVYGPAGAEATGAAATEVGGGLYSYAHTDATDGDYTAVFKTADATVDAQHVPALAATPVWDYGSRTLTQSAASVVSSVSGSTITATRGDTLSASITGLGSLAGRTKLWFTVKSDPSDTDSEALLQITETGGLTVVNGAAYATTTNGSITVTDEATGALTLALAAAVTDDLPIGGYAYDYQQLNATGVHTLTTGTFVVTADITRAIA